MEYFNKHWYFHEGSAILYCRGGNYTLSLKSQAKTLSIHNIDDNIFKLCYDSHCMQCGCKDDCCSYGCPVDIVEVERILVYKDELEKRLGISASRWFSGEAEFNPDYPSKQVRRTSVFNGNCIFHDWTSRGCLLHRMALEKGIDPHLIKPMVCFLFPITWDGDYLHVAEFLDELPCKQQGEVIIDSMLPEIRYYLGEDVAREIEHIRDNISQNSANPAV